MKNTKQDENTRLSIQEIVCNGSTSCLSESAWRLKRELLEKSPSKRMCFKKLVQAAILNMDAKLVLMLVSMFHVSEDGNEKCVVLNH